MRNRILLTFLGIFLLLPAPTGSFFAITAVVTTNAAQAIDNPTTTGVNSTGANLLVCATAGHASVGAGTLTDSKSNTWVSLTIPTLNNSARARLHYSTNNPTVGSAHTFTLSGTGLYAVIVCGAFAGAHSTAPFSQESGLSAASGTTIQPGSLTPSENGSLFVTGLAMDADSGGTSIDGSFSTPITVELGGGAERGGSFSYYIQPTIAAINPTWTSINANAMTTVMAVFNPSAGGGGGAVPSFLNLMGCCQ